MLTILISVLSATAAIYYFGFIPQGRKQFRQWMRAIQKQIEQSAQDYKRYYRTRNKIFVDIEGFSATQTIFSIDGKTGIAIDDRSKNVCLLNNPTGIFPCDTRRVQRLVILYRDILEVAVYEDGNSITKTSRTSQVAGAIIGNVLLGGVGLVIGAFTGAKKTSNTVQSLEVRLTINSTQSPFWAFTFLRTETSKNKVAYKTAMEGANRLLSLLKVLIKQADDEDRILEIKQQQNQSSAAKSEKDSHLDLARQGDIRAIGALINRSLQSQGIVAKARIQGDKIQISLASEMSPKKDVLVPFIHKGIMSLNIDSIEILEIMGYQLGEGTPNWSKTLRL